MDENRYNAQEISHKLNETDALLALGQTISQACEQVGITDRTYYRWRKVYGGMRVDQVERFKDLEAENARLEGALAVLAVDKLILKDVAEGRH